ncbi:hypothetical protein N431DRAFT_473111 [Stipitochalara longipes BDJ]|nr:hypothetical protein N431DRAFT_473111 [Stipitochalara longipes BDJ]
MSSKSSSSSEETPLIVSLENPTVDPTSTATSYQTIRVSCGDEYLDIELRRTFRLPLDDALRSVPAGFGCFPIYLVDQYASRLPKSIKGGVFIPIYQREAMWISFNCIRPFAVKIFANDLNIISGKPNIPIPPPKKAPLMRRLSISLQGQTASTFQRPIPQDYVVPPKQHWIDGIVRLDGIAQQFVANPIDNIVSLADKNKNAMPVKIQFEITPTKNKNMWVYIELVNEPTVPMLRLEADARENIRQLIDEVLTKMAIPQRKVMRISFEGDLVGDFDTLDTLEASRGDTIYVYLDKQSNTSGHGLGAGTTAGKPVPTSRGSSTKGLNKSQRGGVEQIIHQDFMPSSEWDTKNRITFPVYLIRACDFKAITGFNPPPTPVSAAAYAKNNFEFREEYTEPGIAEEMVNDEEEEFGKENRRPQRQENVYDSPMFEEYFQDNESTPHQEKHLSIRNFV